MILLNAIDGLFKFFVSAALIGAILFVLGGFAGDMAYNSMSKEFEPKIESFCKSYPQSGRSRKCEVFFHVTESNKMFFNDKAEWDELVLSKCTGYYREAPKVQRLRNTKSCIERFNQYPYQFKVPYIKID